jgi:hypothetical protein
VFDPPFEQTTLIVPVAQGVQGVPIPRRIWTAVAIALAGLALFTADTSYPRSGSNPRQRRVMLI